MEDRETEAALICYAQENRELRAELERLTREAQDARSNALEEAARIAEPLQIDGIRINKHYDIVAAIRAAAKEER